MEPSCSARATGVHTREAAHGRFQQALSAAARKRSTRQAPCGYLSTTPAGLITKANSDFPDLDRSAPKT